MNCFINKHELRVGVVIHQDFCECFQDKEYYSLDIAFQNVVSLFTMCYVHAVKDIVKFQKIKYLAWKSIYVLKEFHWFYLIQVWNISNRVHFYSSK